MSGWEPATFTRYEYEQPAPYESAARWRWVRVLLEWAWRVTHPPLLVSAVTELEPEWSDTDRQSLLAYLEAGRVGSHGHPMSEATSPGADPSSEERTHEYVVPNPRRDYAAQALQERQEAYKKTYPDADMSSLVWRVEKRELS